MNSLIGWIGGKKLLRSKIVNTFPKEYNKMRYVEVFGGAGWVLFHKEESKEEYYNDMNKNLTNLFKIVKHHPNTLIEELDFKLNARDVFLDEIEKKGLKGRTDIQKAANFFYLIKNSYGCKGENFGDKKQNSIKAIEYIKDISKRLNKTIIENLDFEKIINKLDSENTLFYLDPPYYETEKYYKDIIFTKDDHKRLKEILDNIEGKFVLSYNDCEYIRNLYKDYNIESIDRNNNMVSGGRGEKRFKEVMIKNYK